MRIRDWKKIVDMQEGRLTRIAYEEERKTGRWDALAQETGRLMVEVGLEEEWKQQESEGTQEDWEVKTDAVVKAWAEKQWKEERDKMVKLRMYGRVNEKN